jgi:hypothetical protein
MFSVSVPFLRSTVFRLRTDVSGHNRRFHHFKSPSKFQINLKASWGHFLPRRQPCSEHWTLQKAVGQESLNTPGMKPNLASIIQVRSPRCVYQTNIDYRVRIAQH